MAGAHQVKRLVRIFGGKCHYCGVQTRKSTCKADANLYPTRDHIVPKSLGGPNSIDNYVLACFGCNNDRGTSLFYCKCIMCETKIQKALSDPEAMQRMFEGIIEHNKPRIRIVRGPEKFSVRIGHGQKKFKTFEAAVEFATSGAFAKDREYA